MASSDEQVPRQVGPQLAEPPRAVLADRFSALARVLQQPAPLQETLDEVVAAARAMVPGAEHASISSVVRRREVRTRAASSPLVRAVDAAQYAAGQGPCLDALYTQHTVLLDDLRLETRWPAFVARAVGLGVGSVLAVRLFTRDDDLGALNLVSSRAHVFDEESEHVALLFAAHAAVAMAGAQERERLMVAMSTRDVIGQAKGILMERFKISAEQAFALLVRASQDSGAKLRDVAGELVSSGALPDEH